MSDLSDQSLPCGVCAGLTDGALRLDRRTFLSRGALAALGAAVVACGGTRDAMAPSSITRVTLTIADHPELATVGGVALVETSGGPVAVVRTATAGNSQFLVLSRVCPHQQVTVSLRANGFFCTGHGAEFDAHGVWTGGQSTSNLVRYPTSYDAAAGTVTIG